MGRLRGLELSSIASGVKMCPGASRQLTRRLTWLASLLLLFTSNLAAAQVIPPPRQDTSSAGGVSYRSGSFSYQETDLSIGDGTGGITFSRSYNSSTSAPSDIFTQGWSHSMLGFVSAQLLPQDPNGPQLPTQRAPYVYNVSVGGKSVGFLGGSRYSSTTSTGGPVGTYTPIIPNGATLVFNGTTPSGYYTFTDSDGSVVNFTTGAQGRIANWTFPDGTRLDFTYSSAGSVQSVFSNRGIGLLLSSAQVCAVNLTQSFVTPTSSCPPEATTVTYTYTPGVFNTGQNLLASATKAGQTTSYTYVGADHLGCIKEPGQTICKIQNQYGVCPPDPNYGYSNDNTLRFRDPVTNQQDGGGQTYAYSYQFTSCKLFPGQSGYSQPDYRPYSPVTTSVTDASGATTTVEVTTASMPDVVTDPLGRVTNISYQGNVGWSNEEVLIAGRTEPEGNAASYAYDARGNITSKILQAKAGSGLPNITLTASYQSTCANIKTCNKPDYTIDGSGNRTDFTYSPDSGGVLTETGPADSSGVHPVKRFAYAQRFAWIKNGSGGYSQASSPIWLLTEERTCQTSATVNGACAAGAGDEVIVTYDYGPDAGPNNLWLRGKVVTSGGTSLRTCYGYDYNGNKISETKPRAGLAVCS